MAISVTKLTKKDVPFFRRQECQIAFDILKEFDYEVVYKAGKMHL